MIGIAPWADKWEMIEENMGGGGQGATHLVRSKQTKELAVLKTLKNANCPQARKRMRLEVVSLQTLADYGARVPRPLDDNLEAVDQIDVPLYFVMEYVVGRTLERVITEDGSFELIRAIEVVEQISETIALGHKEKLIHRDLKPKNIILGTDTDGRSIATVLDYGISFNNQHDDGLTRTQESFWNEFLSLPETNVQGNDRRDFRTDVTALCGLFFYCLTSRVPQLLLDGQGKLPHQRASVVFTGVPPNSDEAALLQAFFNRGFRPRVNDRFDSVEDMLKQLDMIRKCASADRDSIAVAAGRNSELLRLHDRTTQLVKIKEKIAKRHQALEQAIDGLLKNEGLDLFSFRMRTEDISQHDGVMNLKLEWVYPHARVRQLHVSPHPQIREIAYGLGVSGDDLIFLKLMRNANPGKLGPPEEISRMPLNDELDLIPIVQDFKSWLINAMGDLRTQILPTLQQAATQL